MKQILLVEDERHLAVGIKFNLQEEGYRVTVAEDGPTALRLVSESPDRFHLIILDLMLPGMSGYRVCETLREREMDIPILVLSARTLPEDRSRAFQIGANQYLHKPFDLDELLSRVQNLLSLRQASGMKRSPIQSYTFGEAAIDFETFEVTVAGKHVRLTQMLMKLLQYFVQNEGRVIPRSELLENVWNMPGHVNTRAVDQFIRRLRKNFEPDPAKPRYFLTIRDAGYRFVAKGIDEAGKSEARGEAATGESEP